MTPHSTGTPPSESTRNEPDRASAPVARKLLILGLDGATFTVLNPLMAEGRMPRLRAAVEAGTCGTLYSTVPPITPAAWTTCLTGRHPGSHRILDFEGYDVRTGRLRMNSTRSSEHVRNIFQILGDRGFRVGSVNVPMTYPPIPVNGFLVTGFETPGSDSDFAYPADLKKLILERWPDPTLKSKWRKKLGGGNKLFAENIAYLSNSFHQGIAMTTWLGDRYGWDVLMVVLKLVDNLQHKTWKYLDPRWSNRNPARRDMAKGCFEELDRAIGKMLDYADKHGATVLMVSDHGHGSLEGKVFPNRFLQKWGYLRLLGMPARIAARGRFLRDRMFGPKHQIAPLVDITRHVPVDLSRTRACVMHAGNAGFLYINLKGRQPGGIVEPSEYESLRNEIMERFRSQDCRVRAPSGETIELFPEVHKPEELYGCTRKEEPWLPDLILIQHETLSAVRRLNGRQILRWLSYRRLEGTHRKEGILIATGPGIAKGNSVTAGLIDCAPTVLAMLGLRVPDNMPGRVILEIFDRPPVVQRERVAEEVKTKAASPQLEQVYTQSELDQVTDRLADLGYLE
ncbi:MAG: alkaline phosphatase family protein [Planctomycetes bacterium]|nr:alkaline phosphatase family protein [Planctomycetota bacterium]